MYEMGDVGYLLQTMQKPFIWRLSPAYFN